MNLHEALTSAAAAALKATPNKVLALFGTTRCADGWTLAADVRVSEVAVNLLSEDFAGLSPVRAREIIEADARMGAGPRIDVGAVWEDTIADIPVRFYRPAGYTDRAQDLPTVLYMHGGGWVTGSPDTHDNTARFLCRGAQVQVIQVDYPLAPEYPFPHAHNAVGAVVDEVLGGGVGGVDKHRVAVAGDSAGATLSAVACLERAARNETQPAMQMLFVPATNLAEISTASHREFASGHYLTRKQLDWYYDHYLGTERNRREWRVSPLFAPRELLAKVAPAYIAVAGFDPLRDEGIAYAEALSAAGTHTTLVVHQGLVHPFVNAFYVWQEANEAMWQAVGALRFGLGVQAAGGKWAKGPRA
ncbi:alpha/beta hydrolase [Corynebacterium mayonis]|uniref:alpha/beta hydrolase n=1 Tax=Corynebacterium mayonis TaxID=3062461 RepID=UPI003140A504